MIDWHRVGELRDDVGAEDFDDVVELFLEEVAEVIERLESAPDPTQFEAVLHFLKGSALNVGFSALGKICSDGELLANTGQATNVDIPAVIDTYRASITVFKERLARSQAA